MSAENTIAVEMAVFTKPWPGLAMGELAAMVHGMGFDAAEVPVRPGFQVEPERVAADLPRLVKTLGDAGVKVCSVASGLDEPVFAACAETGVPIIRIMAPVRRGAYAASEEDFRHLVAEALPLAEKYGVRIGVQPHQGDFINSGVTMHHALKGFDAAHVGVIWDAAHDALAGVAPETGLDIVWDQLLMVNLKNAYYERVNGPEADAAEWRPHFTTGQHGLASWPRVAAELIRRGYQGTVCLTAEYDPAGEEARLVVKDLTYARGLLLAEGSGRAG
ncbi:MAG TPA: TIM barrel protein [Candidatus Dormibacteraeota bacterium]|jgi:sugar phosphate isomerase/epimerase|nr:TIM barrel protein [Candidatus Dormibacteraeota bacterium]